MISTWLKKEEIRPTFGPDAIDGGSLRQWVAGLLGQVQETETEMQLGPNNFTRTWLVTGYPEGPAYVGRLDRLYRLHLSDPEAERIQVRVTQHLIPSALPDGLATRWLRRRQEGMVDATGAHGTPDAATAKGLQAYSDIYNAVAFGEDRVYEMWIAVHITGPDRATLDRMEQRLRGEVAAMNLAVTPLYQEQAEGLGLGHVLGQRQTRLMKAWPGRLTHTAPLAYLHPWLHGSISQGRGVYTGHEYDRLGFRHACYIDFAAAPAMNWILCGKTGEGKTTLERALCTGLLAEGFQLTVWDASGEHADYCDFVGGKHVNMTLAGGRYFEPLVIPAPVGDTQYDSGRYMRTSQLFYCVLTGLASLTPEESSIADDLLMALWQGVAVDHERPETWHTPLARRAGMMDWYRLLANSPERAAITLRAKIKRFFEGTTPIFKTVEDTEWTPDVPYYRIAVDAITNDAVTETAATVKTLLATHHVWDAIVANKARGLQYAMVCVSEGQRVLRVPEMAKHLYLLATDGRKHNAGLSLSTNDVTVFFETEGGQGIWDNATMRALFYMEDSALQRAAAKTSIPAPVLDSVRRLHKTHQYMMTTDLQRWVRARMELPDVELSLNKSRGLAPNRSPGGTG